MNFIYQGMHYDYDDITIFHVEHGRLDNQYKIKHICALPDLAIKHYETMVVENGDKKRLSMIKDGKRTLIAKQLTHKRTRK